MYAEKLYHIIVGCPVLAETNTKEYVELLLLQR
jgi:hypothetical protein